MLKKLIKILTIITLINSYSFAQDAVLLNKDDKAPFNGFLLPQEKLQELHNNTLERDAFQKENESLNKSLNLQQTNLGLKDNQINILLNQNDNLAKALGSERTLNNWEKTGYFIGGIIVTGLAIKAAHDLYHP